MIKKSIICFVLFLILHAIVVILYPDMGIGTNQWQENQIRAQKVLYSDHDTIVIGTSLSARLLTDSLPSLCICSFSACVVEDGLRLISHKQNIPRLILIETNYFLRPSNGKLVDANTNGVMAYLRKYIPVLREQNSPICILCAWPMQGALMPSEIVDKERLTNNIEQRLLEDKTHILTKEQIKSRLKTIMSMVHDLENRGAKVVLFEMPLNNRLKHIPSNDQTRKIVHSVFPKDKYIYLPDDTACYLTNDGEHLDALGQRRFSHYLKQIISNTQL